MPSGMHSPVSRDTLGSREKERKEKRKKKTVFYSTGNKRSSIEDSTANRAPSASNRSFLTRAYPTMKHHNPHTPIMVREALNTQPRVFARYEFGREKVEDLGGESLIFLFCLSEVRADVGEGW
jgi:hypothetical protein